jgi:nucleoside phosphorylase
MADQHDNHEHGAGHDEVAVEESSLSNGGILFFFGLTALVFFGSAAALGSAYYKITDYVLHEKNFGQTSADLTKQRQLEEERLTTYGYADKDKKFVRMPIDVAMQKVVEDAKK